MAGTIVNGKKLEAEMVLRGFNRKTLSAATGLSRNTVSAIISGQQSPSYRAMTLIYETLKLNPQDAMAIFFSPNLHKTQEDEVS